MLVQFRLTLKAFANSSPGLRLATLGSRAPLTGQITLKGLLRDTETRRNSFRVATKQRESLPQGFKANPGLELANAFSVNPNCIGTSCGFDFIYKRLYFIDLPYVIRVAS